MDARLLGRNAKQRREDYLLGYGLLPKVNVMEVLSQKLVCMSSLKNWLEQFCLLWLKERRNSKCTIFQIIRLLESRGHFFPFLHPSIFFFPFFLPQIPKAREMRQISRLPELMAESEHKLRIPNSHSLEYIILPSQ